MPFWKIEKRVCGKPKNSYFCGGKPERDPQLPPLMDSFTRAGVNTYDFHEDMLDQCAMPISVDQWAIEF